MYIEIVTVPQEELPLEAPTPFRVIAVQYPLDMTSMELLMRKANALFDTVVPGMSSNMLRKMQSGVYRTAVLQLAQPT